MQGMKINFMKYWKILSSFDYVHPSTDLAHKKKHEMEILLESL